MELPGLPPDRYHWRTPLASVVTGAAMVVGAVIGLFWFGPSRLLLGSIVGGAAGLLLSVGLIFLLSYLFGANRK